MAAIRLSCTTHGPLVPRTVNARRIGRLHWSHEYGKAKTKGAGVSLRRKPGTHPVLIKPQTIVNYAWGSSAEFEPSSGSPSATVEQFYSCINNRSWKKLVDLISDDCCFEDYSYAKPFNGKKEVMHFFRQLVECMGKNMKFVPHSMFRGNDALTIAVLWHLEWNNHQIPFTRGCSFFECTEQEERFLIRHAQVLIESPVKLGALALTTLKLVTSFFDEFPSLAEKFLQRPHVILQFLLKMYNIFVEPFLHPIVSCYINLWKFLAQVLGYILNILTNIAKILF